MTPERLAEINAMLAAATPGPWAAVGQGLHPTGECPDYPDPLMIATAWEHPQLQGPLPIVTLAWGICFTENPVLRIEIPDATLIAAAPTIIAELLTEVERYQEYEANARWEDDAP